LTETKNTKNDAVDISDEDVIQGIAALPGYIDITPSDFKEVYRAAYAHALKRMMTSVKARDIMTRPVLVVQADATLVQTASLLAEKNISGVPVVDGSNQIIGVVSEKDFLKNMGSDAGESFMEVIANCLNNNGCVAAPIRAKTAGDLMSHPAVTARENISVADIAALFAARRINRLPIVDEKNQPVGLVARSDLVNAYCLLG
jgi:CBS domain-containing membrane protein